jgi:MerR family transcriptional regulator, light-induced transcriptional regulator
VIDEILEEAARFQPVPLNAAMAYSENRDILIEAVNEIMTKNANTKKLIGRNPLSVMYDNHENHAAFMSNVFKLNDYALMAKVVLWVYFSYRKRGFSDDYFPVAMEAWIEAIHRVISPNTARPLVNVYRWIINKHNQLLLACDEEQEPPMLINKRWKEQKEKFLSSLLSGEYNLSQQIARETIQSADDLKDFYLQEIQSSLYEIGRMWESGEISVAREHLASAIVTRVMASLYGHFIIFEKTRGKAVVTAAPNEFHEIGPRMVADLLEIDGWDVDYMGANVPARDLVVFLKKKKPFLVAISIAMPFNIDRARETIDLIRGNSNLKKMKIMIGGRCISFYPQIENYLGADGSGKSAKEAVELAARWWSNAQ